MLTAPRPTPSTVAVIANTGCFFFKPLPHYATKHESVKREVIKYLSSRNFVCEEEVEIKIPVVTSHGQLILITGKPDLLCRHTRENRTLVIEVKSRDYITIGDIVQLSAYILGVIFDKNQNNVEGAIAISNDVRVEIVFIDMRELLSQYNKFSSIVENIVSRKYVIKPGPYCKHCIQKCPLLTRMR